jgi:hypothetical protein
MDDLLRFAPAPVTLLRRSIVSSRSVRDGLVVFAAAAVLALALRAQA